MLNTEKTTRQSTRGSEVTYSGSVTAVTPKTTVVFIPALDVEVDVQRNPDASVQNASAPEVGDSATVQMLCSKVAIMLSPLPTFFCLMTITRRQKNTTGTTSLP